MEVFDSWRRWSDATAGLVGRLSEHDIVRLADAYSFAERFHGEQTRPAGEPYVEHLLQVVEVLATRLGVNDVDLLTAGLLHDVVEDTPCPLVKIRERFGNRTADLVDHVTMPPIAPDQDPAEARRTYLTQLQDSSTDCRRLKLADRYSNVQRLHTHPSVAKQRAYYAETCRYLIPTAAFDPELRRLFRTWQRSYDYLVGQVDTVDAANKLATALHRGQVDKSGAAYIEHPRAVARIARAYGADTPQQLAALLHDTVEDTTCTLDQLISLGVPRDVVGMIDALSRRPSEPHHDYLTRMAKTPAAILVKRADIDHNRSAERLSRLDRPTRERLQNKYDRALSILDRLEEQISGDHP